ncbi:MAG: response regulator transcription factor [Firmicutes bacterium]|nr:response regulator transcription factor [Bacillota bacterium]
MANKHILVVDDEARMRSLVRAYFEKEGFTVEEAGNGEEAIKKTSQKAYDLVILDLMLPRVDGWSVCRKIREKSFVPIIMLTARGAEEERLLGFDLGADDYVVKPFSPRELLARARALLRRSSPPTESTERVEAGHLQIDPVGRLVTIQGERVALTPKEFDLLLHLARHPGRVFSREQLLEQVWGYDFYGDLRTVDTHVKTLREKVSRSRGLPHYIQTVWGIGYKFEVKDRT